jgi:hypothetical protein
MSRVTVCVQASWYNFGTFVDAHSLTRPGIRHKRQPDPHDFARAVDRRGTWIVTVAGCIRDGGYFFHVQVVQAKNIVGDFESNSPIRLDVILPHALDIVPHDAPVQLKLGVSTQLAISDSTDPRPPTTPPPPKHDATAMPEIAWTCHGHPRHTIDWLIESLLLV